MQWRGIFMPKMDVSSLGRSQIRIVQNERGHVNEKFEMKLNLRRERVVWFAHYKLALAVINICSEFWANCIFLFFFWVESIHYCRNCFIFSFGADAFEMQMIRRKKTKIESAINFSLFWITSVTCYELRRSIEYPWSAICPYYWGIYYL